MLDTINLAEELKIFEDPFLTQIKNTTRKCNKLTILYSEATSLTDSKLLGCPYWPRRLKYPINSYGGSMMLLVQINCEDLIVPLGFPKTGILQVFIDEGSWSDTLEHKIIYHATSSETDVIKDFEDEVDLYERPSEYDTLSIAFSEDLEIPHPNDIEFEKEFGFRFADVESFSEEYYNLATRSNSIHKMGAYTDWRYEAGHLFDRSEFIDGKKVEDVKNYIPLIQLHSKTDVVELQGLRTIIFINKSDLKNLNFSNTKMHVEIHL